MLRGHFRGIGEMKLLIACAARPRHPPPSALRADHTGQVNVVFR